MRGLQRRRAKRQVRVVHVSLLQRFRDGGRRGEGAGIERGKRGKRGKETARGDGETEGIGPPAWQVCSLQGRPSGWLGTQGGAGVAV